jgi:hypothetical protein
MLKILPSSPDAKVYEAVLAVYVDEIFGEDITGAVKVLFVNVWLVVKSAVTPVLIERVTSPDVPPPDNPVPAATPVMSPVTAVTHVNAIFVFDVFDNT